MTPPTTTPGDRRRAEFLLLGASAVWGFAFVAQRQGMEHLGPFAFTGIRFGLGALCLALARPLLHRRRRRVLPPPRPSWILVAGLLLFAAAAAQQVGLVYTTAGKAGFITGLYAVFTAVVAFMGGHRPPHTTWVGAGLSTWGLYMLSIRDDFSLAPGDGLELLCALLFAFQIVYVGWVAGRADPVDFALGQFAVCSACNLGVAALVETTAPASVLACAGPILYGGVLSVGVGYTIQVVAQRDAHPAHAAIIMCLESVFAAVGGWYLLGEQLSPRAALGCTVMFAGMLVSQLAQTRGERRPAPPVDDAGTVC